MMSFETGSATMRGAKIRVGLADDHPIVRMGLVAILAQQPDMVVIAEAEDGEQAIALFESHRPDVMVVDLRMPKCDGVEVVRRVRAAHSDARLMILSAYGNDEDVVRSFNHGALAYVLKDAPRQDILAAIRSVSQNQPHISAPIAQRALSRQSEPRLTRRNLEVLQLLATGQSNKVIAGRLNMAQSTVKTHVKDLFAKLDVHSRTQALSVAYQRGLITL